MLLRDHNWLLRYETGLHNLVDDFYVPALSASIRYDRKAGFFSSSALVVAATGVSRLVANGGYMRLLVGVKLSAEDCEAIAKGYQQREEIICEALQRDWTVITRDEIARDRLAALAELVAREALDIRVVAALDADGTPLTFEDAAGMFHEKTGIFTDAEGNQVTFVGSINESEQAWRHNIEHLSVFCSWREDANHAAELVKDFERMWEGHHPRALTLPFPLALRQRLIEYRREDLSSHDPAEQAAKTLQVLQLERQRWLVQFLRDAPLLANGESLVEELTAVKPWPHQRLIRRRVCADYPERWHMLCDEVGLGKTIEAGLVLRTLILDGRVRRALILVPPNLVRQWQEELREKFNLWAYRYTGSGFVDPLGSKLPAPENGWDADYRIIIASIHLASRRERLEHLLAARQWDLVLVDEAHHARRNWAENRYTLALRLLEALRERTKALLLMTATPMQIEVRELWELLRLVGMEGRWRAHKDFARYFETLRQPQWSQDDVRFLTELNHEFFATGGETSRELQAEFRRLAGGSILWDQLTSRLRRPDPARIQEALRQPRLRPLIIRFLEHHTPVRRFMFRHTREIIRAYQRQGLLPPNMVIPEREVCDEFIPLGEAQPLYDQIEDYISHLYCKAEADKRHAIGYIMTIYRQRLTSSPWAISETLRRRLEQALALAKGIQDEYLPEEEEWPDDLEGIDLQALWREIEYIQSYVEGLRNLGIDSKLQRLVRDLDTLRTEHPRVVLFTQYTDTMDFVRDELVQTYGSQVACYSGRGGEAWDPATKTWTQVSKDDVKAGFADGRYWILACTEAASEGLNLQASDLLINYDMPWNPMRVEQRIGRIDRIGQSKPQVHIINYYYAGSVEARIYEVLRERLDLFRTAVGPLQPVLGKVTRRIEQAAMARREEKEQVIARQVEQIKTDITSARSTGVSVDKLAQAGVLQEPSPQMPCRPEDVRDVILQSQDLARLWTVAEEEPGVYVYEATPSTLSVTSTRFTFDQGVLEARPTHVEHCLMWGDPLFEELLSHVPAPAVTHWGSLERRKDSEGHVEYVWHGADGEHCITTFAELTRYLERIRMLPE